MPKAIGHKDKVMKIASKLGFDKLRIYPFNNRMGYLKNENDNVNNTPLLHRFCFPLLFIAWDGVIYPCSHDIKGRNVLGNILNIEFDKVKKENYSICERCTICDIKRLKSFKVTTLFEESKKKFGDDAG